MAIDSMMDDVYQSRMAHPVWKERISGGYRYKTVQCPCCGSDVTVEVERQSLSKAAYCSECGKVLSSHYMNYCPNCGAKIGGEE